MWNETEIVQKIKSKSWDNRVHRPGFLQPKIIINEAETQSVQLTSELSVHSTNILWIKSSNLYDNKTVNLLEEIFPKAFQENPTWPLDIIKNLDEAVTEKDVFISGLKKINWTTAASTKLLSVFEQYQNLLKKIQRYYIFAVPLTNYCERQLYEAGFNPTPYAYQIKKLDFDLLQESLSEIKIADANKKEQLIKNHCEKFAWVKTNYNIISAYTPDDVAQELASNFSNSLVREASRNPLVLGLQAAIYLRNRMKELSQQLWYAIEPFGQVIAQRLSLHRDDFFQLTPPEVVTAISLRECPVTPDIIQARHQGFLTGVIDNERILLTGPAVDELYAFYNQPTTHSGEELRGTPTCRGRIKAKVHVIHSPSELDDFQAGEILVTSMTTPDFIIAIKKAAAIVTDEGGLSCHAAIVSREFSIPCIVGTKNATKILKNGDLVEVDASKGTIKKL